MWRPFCVHKIVVFHLTHTNLFYLQTISHNYKVIIQRAGKQRSKNVQEYAPLNNFVP